MKFFEIIKSRWPEVMVVVLIQACCAFLVKDIDLVSTRPEEYSMRLFFLGAGLAAFSIISQMMLWGFLRTTSVTGPSAVQPGALLSVGRVYFWKLFVLQIILIFALILIASIIQVVFSSILYHKPIPDKMPLWLEIVPMLIAGIVLIKPIYFMPAVMLVGDVGIVDAFRYLRQLDLFRMGRFLPLAIGVTLLTGGVELLSVFVHRPNVWYYPMTAMQVLVMSGGLVAVFLLAVIEVCKLKPKSPDENSHNEQAEV
jgi:hypothetical protein